MEAPPTATWIALCVAACALLVDSERRGARAGVWLWKPTAAAAFVAAGVSAGAFDATGGRALVTGLVLCLAGDVLLIPQRSSAAFLLGMLAFLLGHVAYAFAFAAQAPSGRVLALAAPPVALAGALVLRWLRPRLHGVFVWAVPAYVVVIGSMVAIGVAASFGAAAPGAALGALMFALSDVSVARERFVAPGFANSAWGLPLYFAAQLVLATSALHAP